MQSIPQRAVVPITTEDIKNIEPFEIFIENSKETAIRTQLQTLKEQAQRQYLLQNLHLVSTNELVNSPKVQAFFSDLLNTYAEKFAKSKNLDISLSPLKFAGLYAEPNPGNGYRKM
ncbi:6731_t:CDS:2, partial [Funneliformis geosporum]